MAVIDGSTSKTPLRVDPSMTNGRLAMTVIRDYISRMPATITCKEFCDAITRQLLLIYIGHHVDLEMLRHHPETRLAASAAVYSLYHREVWLVGDCQAIVNGILHKNEKLCERMVAERRVSFIHQGYSPQEARRMVEPFLIDTMKGQNVDYAVIDGFPIPYDAVKKIKVTGEEIVLASDGYPFLCDTLEESENRLKRHLSHDPQNIHDFLATKGLVEGNLSFDDRAYIRFVNPTT